MQNRIDLKLLLLLIIWRSINGQTVVVKFGDLRFMERDTSFIYFHDEKFLIKKTLPDGKYVVKAKRDTIFIHNIMNNDFEGEQISFQNGYRLKKSIYRNHLKILDVEFFNGKNHISSIENYENGLKNGPTIFYFDNDSISRIEYYYCDSISKWETFYRNGHLKANGFGDFTYREGFLNEFYENGILKKRIYFTKGRPIYFTSFYDSGIIQATGYFEVYSEDVRAAYSMHFRVNPERYFNPCKSEIYFFDESGKFIQKAIVSGKE